jgi:nitric-oxide synthase
LSGNSLFWGGLVRIDVVKALPRTRLTFYGPKKLKINMVPTTEADEFYEREVGVTLTPPAGKEKAEGWVGLQGVRELQIKYEESDRPACDIAISGLGWVAVEPLGVPSSNPDESAEEEDNESGELHLRVHVPKPVEIFVRPPLPVGKAASQWYRYQELTEEEEELRPKWHY